MSWEREHLIDPRDLCDATVLLDDVEVLVEVVEPDEPAPESYRRRRRTEYGWLTRGSDK